MCDADTGQCTRSQTTYRLQAFGKCHATDCDWGTRTTADMGGGWQRAVYQHAWATNYVWVKTYQYYGRTYLRVWANTDFTAADGRPRPTGLYDRRMDAEMTPQQPAPSSRSRPPSPSPLSRGSMGAFLPAVRGRDWRLEGRRERVPR